MKSRKNLLVLVICFSIGLMAIGGFIQQNRQTANAAPLSDSDYDVSYVIQSDWGSGAVINVTIKNTGVSAIDGWNLTWTFPGNQRISNMWNAVYTQNNAAITAKNSSYNSKIAAGDSISFGFIMSYSGSNKVPTDLTLIGTATPDTTITPTVTATATASVTTSATSTATPDTGYRNPDHYINQTTISVLPANVVDISKRTQEFQGLVKNCTKVAYAYADPAENADPAHNTSKDGAASFAAYIFGYDNTTTTEFLNAKKYVPYVLNKLYFDSKYRNTWYKTLTNNGNGVCIILEKPENISGAAGVKFGNTKDGFGMRLGAGCMSNDWGRHVLFHEMSHCIWDTSGTTNDFYVGVDPRTNIDYGTGNLITLFNKLYNDSISKNTFYSGSYGWDYSHENFAESAAKFFTKDFQSSLLANDPVVYNILSQIYTKFNF